MFTIIVYPIAILLSIRTLLILENASLCLYRGISFFYDLNRFQLKVFELYYLIGIF